MSKVDKKEETANLIKIGEAVLSPKAIEQLASMQREDNDTIECYSEVIHNTIAVLMTDEFDNRKDEIWPLIKNLNYLCKALNDLSIP